MHMSKPKNPVLITGSPQKSRPEENNKEDDPSDEDSLGKREWGAD
jgi:hypothetical protein